MIDKRGMQGKFNISTVDRHFISANFSDAPTAGSTNNNKFLLRFEFFEVLVRIARTKFIEGGSNVSYEDALESLFNEHLLHFPKI